MTMPATAAPAALAARLTANGFAFVDGAVVATTLGPLPDWPRFAASWRDLPRDAYMADGGRYRRRRHARLACSADGELTALPAAPHYQDLAYNPLNGGVERWLAPLAPADHASPALAAVLGWAHQVAQALMPEVRRWLIEVHQFRIEAGATPGRPTPEGIHRDGVDLALALLVERTQVHEGTTTVHDADGARLGEFTLTHPLDAALLDDRRVWHGVTPIVATPPHATGHRDVLVATFVRAPLA